MEDFSIHFEAEVWLYADLLGKRASKNPDSKALDSIIVTAAWPDIVLTKDKMVILLELTIPHNSSDLVELTIPHNSFR